MTQASSDPLTGTSFDAVIFDLDGTLIDSHTAMVRSYSLWADEFGIDLAQLPGMLGMPSAAVTEALLPSEHHERATARIEELEVTDTDGVVSLPGAHDALVTLGSRAAIATSCTFALMSARTAAAGLPVPDVAVTRDMVEHGKPAPDSFLLAAARLGVDPARALVVEDAPAGVAAARAAGMRVLGITSTKSAEDLQADAHVADLSEVRWNLSGNTIRLTLTSR